MNTKNQGFGPKEDHVGHTLPVLRRDLPGERLQVTEKVTWNDQTLELECGV